MKPNAALGSYVRDGVLDTLLDDEGALREAVAPLVALARKRDLAPPTEEATLKLLDALCAVQRWRRAVETEALPW